ncbi:hypothetical protein [Candidatus Nitrosocosmicus hydrocola]|nr:hypothetical protein [Candidatus Nitrosocosmicus hydrocola]
MTIVPLKNPVLKRHPFVFTVNKHTTETERLTTKLSIALSVQTAASD